MTDRLSFSNRSTHKRPGAGPGERALSDYSDLAAIEDWRRILADEYEFFLEVDGHVYSSITEGVAVLGTPLRLVLLRHKFKAWGLRQALLATGAAELWRSGTGGRAGVRDLVLERVRAEYKASAATSQTVV